MKIKSDGFSENLHALDKIFSTPQRASAKHTQRVKFIDNGYSSLLQKELNHRIGILQTALQTLRSISDENALPAIVSRIHNTQFFGQKIYENGFVMKGENGENLFDANTILDAIPGDERDLYLFKKVLKNEIAFLEGSLEKLADSAILRENLAESGVDSTNYATESAFVTESTFATESSADSASFEYLKNNANLFSKAHNTASLRSKIDALLA